MSILQEAMKRASEPDGSGLASAIASILNADRTMVGLTESRRHFTPPDILRLERIFAEYLPPVPPPVPGAAERPSPPPPSRD
jgi:hypothetical protein